MGVFDLIYPKKCLECGKGKSYICESCLAKVGKPKLACIECQKLSIDGKTHARCTKKFSIDYAYSVWGYEGVIRKAILKLKYNFAFDIARELANKFTDKIKSDLVILPKNAVITPVPLHTFRQNWRGFNQSEELGKIIAGNFGWQFYPDILIRRKSTKPQVELKGQERKENVQGVFALNPNYPIRKSLTSNGASQLLSTNYILFDDVLTTGSTLKEGAKVLKRNGIKNIWGLTIAS